MCCPKKNHGIRAPAGMVLLSAVEDPDEEGCVVHVYNNARNLTSVVLHYTCHAQASVL